MKIDVHVVYYRVSTCQQTDEIGTKELRERGRCIELVLTGSFLSTYMCALYLSLYIQNFPAKVQESELVVYSITVIYFSNTNSR